MKRALNENRFTPFFPRNKLRGRKTYRDLPSFPLKLVGETSSESPRQRRVTVPPNEEAFVMGGRPLIRPTTSGPPPPPPPPPAPAPTTDTKESQNNRKEQ